MPYYAALFTRRAQLSDMLDTFAECVERSVMGCMNAQVGFQALRACWGLHECPGFGDWGATWLRRGMGGPLSSLPLFTFPSSWAGSP